MFPDFKDGLNPWIAVAGVVALDRNAFARILALTEMPTRSLRWIDCAQNVLVVQ